MAGRPSEHLIKSLEKHIGVLREIKDIEVHEIKISEPKVIPVQNENQSPPQEKSPEMFTAFVECEFEVPNFARLSDTMFDFMPSSVEVIEPSKIYLEATEATDLLNNISGRMHRYDEIAKIAEERLTQQDEQIRAMQKAIIIRDLKIVQLSSNNSNKRDESSKNKKSDKKK